jgi:two-component system chemotaxis response regulator CheY
MALNVLVADDSAVMRAMIIKTLRLCGLALNEIHEAGNGEEALQTLEHHWIDLVLLDINMPVMNGEEVLQRLQHNPETADIPVIVVSTEGSDLRIAALRQYGAAFIHKPFTPETLRTTVISMTGVCDEQHMEDGSFAGSGPDF